MLTGNANCFNSEILPGEGTPVYHSKVDVLTLYDEPSLKSKNHKHKWKRGDLILYKDSRYKTVRNGKIKVVKAVAIPGRDLETAALLTSERYLIDAPDIKIQFKKGDMIDYLQERAEGGCLIRLRGRIIELEYCPWFDESNSDFKTIVEAVTEQWIRVVKKEKPIGWLLIDDKNVDEDREF